MKKFSCIIFSLFAGIGAYAYYPIVRNYTKDEYKGAGKNWQIYQSPYGNMYFANDAGILESNIQALGHGSLRDRGNGTGIVVCRYYYAYAT